MGGGSPKKSANFPVHSIPESVVCPKGTGGNAGAPRYLERRKLARVFDQLPAPPFNEGPVFCGNAFADRFGNERRYDD